MPNETLPPYDYLIKGLLAGSAAVGKSALLARYCDDTFTPNYTCTIGIDFKVRTIETENKTRVKLQIWDTAGQERFRTITRTYYSGAKFIILCFSLTDKKSFDHLRHWITEIKEQRPNTENLPFLLVGTKADANDKREVNEKEAESFARQNGCNHYFEVSAKENINVDALFNTVIELSLQSLMQETSVNPDAKLIKSSLTPEKTTELINSIYTDLFKFAGMVSGIYGGKELTLQGKTARYPTGISAMLQAKQKYSDIELLQRWQGILQAAKARGEGFIFKRLPKTNAFYENTLASLNQVLLSDRKNENANSSDNDSLLPKKRQ